MPYCLYFKGLPKDDETKQIVNVISSQRQMNRSNSLLISRLKDGVKNLKGYEAEQSRYALAHWKTRPSVLRISRRPARQGLTAAVLKGMAADRSGSSGRTSHAEPPPRALSPLVYDSRTKLFLLFGGDHLDYLTNDTWIFDSVGRKWNSAIQEPRRRRVPTTP